MVLHTIGNRDPKGFPGSIPGYGVLFYYRSNLIMVTVVRFIKSWKILKMSEKTGLLNKMNKIIFIVLSVLLISAGIFFLVRSHEENGNKDVLTGEVVLTEDILPEFSETVLIDVEEGIESYTNYYREFELNEPSKVNVSLSSNVPIDYILIPEEELKNYISKNLSLDYSVLKNIFSSNEEYNLNLGKYIVILATSDLPVEIDLEVKSVKL